MAYKFLFNMQNIFNERLTKNTNNLPMKQVYFIESTENRYFDDDNEQRLQGEIVKILLI